MNYIYLAVALAIASASGWIGYKVGSAHGAVEAAVVAKQQVSTAQQEVISLQTKLDAQAAEAAHQKKITDESHALADGIITDLRDNTTKTTQQLLVARKQIEALRHAQKPVDDLLSTPIPAALRVQLCNERAGQACNGLH